jgi:hypothetical protein
MALSTRAPCLFRSIRHNKRAKIAGLTTAFPLLKTGDYE